MVRAQAAVLFFVKTVTTLYVVALNVRRAYIIKMDT